MVKTEGRYTALYERLSRDDEIQGTSNSIVGMYFNAKAKESVDDKVKRMIRGEVRAGNISESSGN